jgi:hypothetical protein
LLLAMQDPRIRRRHGARDDPAAVFDYFAAQALAAPARSRSAPAHANGVQ